MLAGGWQGTERCTIKRRGACGKHLRMGAGWMVKGAGWWSGGGTAARDAYQRLEAAMRVRVRGASERRGACAPTHTQKDY